MISKAQVKHIRSLEDKKYRYECKQFTIEGAKMLEECLKSGFEIMQIYAVSNWIHRKQLLPGMLSLTTEVSDTELSRISNLKTPPEVLAVVKMPIRDHLPLISKAIALDQIQDPGNLGSIIRIADWYGIDHLICSLHTADVFNSKVLQATMGSIFRVQCYYTDLRSFFLERSHPDLYACVLDGRSVNSLGNLKEGIILIGNEGRGIDPELISLCNYKISIPRIGHAESLNAAVATGIICNQLFG